jgi:MoaA/NifB/PqqE/SkfB family radical SAM enzyme
MRARKPARRALHLHPTRACNQRCAHCYSASGPERTGVLPRALLLGAVEDAVAEGYGTLSVSGGEPLLYPDLFELLGHAQRLGMETMLTSNGLLLDAGIAERLRRVVDLVLISVDGAPGRHDRMRRRPGAFAETEARLGHLRAAGVPFGLLFTLTRANTCDLEWLAQFAADQRAALLQVRPLEPIGRASQELTGAAPDRIEAAVAWLEARRLQALHAGSLAIHVDLVDREDLRARPELFWGAPPREDAAVRLAELLHPLVVEPDGHVVPLTYGFPRRYALGSLFDAPLAALAAEWRERRHPAFERLCRTAHRDLVDDAAPRLVSLHRAVADRAADVRAAELMPAAPLW